MITFLEFTRVPINNRSCFAYSFHHQIRYFILLLDTETHFSPGNIIIKEGKCLVFVEQ